MQAGVGRGDEHLGSGVEVGDRDDGLRLALPDHVVVNRCRRDLRSPSSGRAESSRRQRRISAIFIVSSMLVGGRQSQLATPPWREQVPRRLWLKL